MIAIFPLLSAAFVYMFESACSSMASVPMYNPSRHYYACLQLTLHLNAQFSFDCVTSHCAANGTSRLTRERAYQWEWLKTVCAFFFYCWIRYCLIVVHLFIRRLTWLDSTTLWWLHGCTQVMTVEKSPFDTRLHAISLNIDSCHAALSFVEFCAIASIRPCAFVTPPPSLDQAVPGL